MLPQSAVPRAQTNIKKLTKKQKKYRPGISAIFCEPRASFCEPLFFFSLQNLSIYEILFQQLASLI